MSEFIALRKKHYTYKGIMTNTSSEPRRAIRLAAAEQTNAVLSALGFQQAQPSLRVIKEKATFQLLNILEAYVVSATNEQQIKQAKEVLKDDYQIVPNLRLSVPSPKLVKSGLPYSPQDCSWLSENGIKKAHSEGITGKGVLVGVLDTGCDADHVELSNKHIEFSYIPLQPLREKRSVRGFDVDGHGTHVCGVIAGKNTGVAPEVDLIVASVIESETLQTSIIRIYVGLEWILSKFRAEENRNKPKIINMSLGFSPYLIKESGLQAAMDVLRNIFSTLDALDILPVVAIGNEGANIVQAPAYFPEALSVGAVDFKHTPASFSGGGISPITGKAEPNIVGYGVDIFSSLERNTDNQSLYARMSGTSMATPYVTGIAALFASVQPELKGKKLRQLMINKAKSLNFSLDRVGAGLANFVP
jgi:subtilisin family serine protease